MQSPQVLGAKCLRSSTIHTASPLGVQHRRCVAVHASAQFKPDGRVVAGVLAVSLFLSPVNSRASAMGLESIEFPIGPVTEIQESREAQFAKGKAVDEHFQGSDTLKALLEKSNANRAKNAQSVRDKYCYRQAELGVGDCGGLRFIPGLTKNGVQKRPSWLDSLLGIQEQTSPLPEGTSLESFFGPSAAE